jgi:molybdate transport system substrate-binding protein
MNRCRSLTIVALAVTLVACSNNERPTLTVAAASDVRLAFEEMEPAFEQACDCDVVFSFGSSGTLATQIEEGLPVDAFFSANEEFVLRLDDQGKVVPDTKQLYAIGRIVVATKGGNEALSSLDELKRGDIRKVSLPNPEHAPYGLAGKEALTALGLWEAIEPKLVLGENASQATAYVQTGDADAGIVPLSLAIQSQGALAYTVIDDGLHNPLRQMAAVIAGADEAELAAQFIAFVNGVGREIMERYGLTLPEEPTQ